METKAKAKHIRMSPKKVRLVVDVIRGMEVDKALAQLRFINKKAVKPVKKIVESAIANAQHNYALNKSNLYIKDINVDEGKTLYRYTPRALGRATPIRKRTSHINVVLGELVDSGVVESRKPEVEAPVKLEDMAKQQEEAEKKNKKEKKKTKGEKKDDKESENKESERNVKDEKTKQDRK
ncbi:MAG: 50S ribosomal protein L22 [Patescibacteria group bacterium]